ncbi:LOW QUALITY PROTEIN: zinc finger protein 653 [Gymnogyps californianus]|uniref:LOW QUALITY PROTEIN: zinc finger protein 653 n=1 Tax=Gymnogyps californianus TaxID=33616 RepID=UPI0021CA0598|nr:LOW QUALITY PROTEIN: zinc finger protein 653 [Gymnogyps californianus]
MRAVCRRRVASRFSGRLSLAHAHCAAPRLPSRKTARAGTEAEAALASSARPAAEPGGGGRKARGRPRLTESDRARRRLESRKKYDVRRVYLGEAHGPWVDLRRRSGWSDAKLAAYLLGLERGQRAGRRGNPWEQIPKKPKRKKRRRRNVNCLRHAVIWYEDHRQRCPYEPRLAELDPSVGLYTTAVWQCERGHRYFQDLHSPLRPLSDSDGDSDDAAPGSSSSSSGGCSSGSEATPGGAPSTPGGAPSAPGGVAVARLQGPPLLILASPGYDALGGLQLRGGGRDALRAAGGGDAFPPAPLDPHLPKTEENEVLGLKQEEVPLPAAEPPPQPPPEPPREPPPPPVAEDADGGDVSAIIYEIPKEPERRRRSRRGRAPHPDPEELPEPIACPYAGCGQVYVALSSFQNHVNLVHRKGRTQQCPQPGCGKRFYLANHLRRHMVIHSGVREFTCETCGKSFKRKNHLEVHRRTHTGETPLQCEVCGYRCRQRASLTWHMRRHGGPGLRPFPCEHCGRRFERPEGLKFHALKSHPEPRGT